MFIAIPGSANAGVAPSYAGSSSCLECHEKFYELWLTSRHGLAMQPYYNDFAQKQLTPQEGHRHQEEQIPRGPEVRRDCEKGPKGTTRYKIQHVLGGKNVFYFLTSFKKGRLQTLPLAYDVNKKEWLDTAFSGVRHFPGQQPDQTINWKNSPYTFNTACYGCHVSQLSTNYNPKTDTYHTDMGRAGHQLRDLPWLIHRAQQDRQGDAEGRAAPRPEDHKNQDHDQRAAQRSLFELPRESESPVSRV